MTNLKKVKRIAKDIRKAFEEIDKKYTGHTGGDLGGHCGRASVQLYLACRRVGIKIGINKGEGHMFNTYRDRIIDITATQFGVRRKVFVRKIPKKIGKLPSYHRTCCTYDTAKSAIDVYDDRLDINRDKRVVLKYIGE